MLELFVPFQNEQNSSKSRKNMFLRCSGLHIKNYEVENWADENNWWDTAKQLILVFGLIPLLMKHFCGQFCSV